MKLNMKIEFFLYLYIFIIVTDIYQSIPFLKLMTIDEIERQLEEEYLLRKQLRRTNRLSERYGPQPKRQKAKRPVTEQMERPIFEGEFEWGVDFDLHFEEPEPYPPKEVAPVNEFPLPRYNLLERKRAERNRAQRKFEKFLYK